MDFKKLRLSFQMTQVEAAKACGIAVVTWRLWENGGGKPNNENLKKVIEVFKCQK